MKKWFLGISFVILLCIACLYIFIPSTIKISTVTTVNCTKKGLYRLLTNDSKLPQWLKSPEPLNNAGPSKQYDYRLNKKLLNGIEISIQNEGQKLSSMLTVLPHQIDSTIITWECSFPAGLNPFKRISRYNDAVAIKKNMDSILSNLKIVAAKTENVYDFPISKSSTNDSLLIATKFTTKAYPSVDEIYGAIGSLRKFITENGAAETNSPMLNVTVIGKDEFLVMIAIPIDKKTAENKTFFFRRLIRGNFMTTLVTGGQSSIDDALQQMQFYFDDYQKTSMAIPFQLLVTDRSMEKDTSKWVTKIYAPVMY